MSAETCLPSFLIIKEKIRLFKPYLFLIIIKTGRQIDAVPFGSKLVFSF